MYDLNSPQLSIGGADQLLDQITGPLVALMWISVIFTVVFLGLYVASFIHKWRVQRAVLEIRDIVKELRDQKPTATSQPAIESQSHIQVDDKPEQTNEQNDTGDLGHSSQRDV